MKELILNRIEELTKYREKLILQVNAELNHIDGGIAELQHLISDIESRGDKHGSESESVTNAA